MVKNPCMICPDAGCGVYHDVCPKYQEYRAYLDKDRERRRKERILKEDLCAIRQRHFMAAEHYKKRG